MARAGDTDWWRGAVIYQIYPRSFRDSNGDGVGDLNGILEKLDYVATLGVDAIWLSPFFTSPMKDFGYDVSDYRDVDPLFGVLADFDRLLAKAHELGLKVIIDQVWSHTSNQHAWFVESASSRDSAKSDWYVWADAKGDGAPPNNWQAVFGGPSWTWHPRRRQYYLHNFLTDQPDLNYWTPAVQEAVLDVARFWLDRGVDGFRLDVINFIFHDRLLRDNPSAGLARPPATATRFQNHLYDISQPQALAFLERLRGVVDGYPDRMLVGEVVDDTLLTRQQEYTATSGRLHTAYSFFLLHADAPTPELFREALTSWSGADGWPAWSLGNHDVARFASRLGLDGDLRRIKMLLAVLMCLRGTAFVYQGEELGLPQAAIPFEKLRDPFAIAAYTGGSGRDGARTPMPWVHDAVAAGFSSAPEPWLPVCEAHRPLAVDAQEGAPDSVLAFCRDIIALRKQSPTLRLGQARVLDCGSGVLGFEREHEGERLICLFDLAGDGGSVRLSEPFSVVLSLSPGIKTEGSLVHLLAGGGAILSVNRRTGRLP